MDHVRFDKTFALNVWAPVLWTGLAWDAWMKEHGGAVVNTASVGAYGIGPAIGVYHASKAALIHLTRHQALELAPKVRVNAVAPGVVKTKLAEALWKGREDVGRRAHPARAARRARGHRAGGRVPGLRRRELDHRRSSNYQGWVKCARPASPTYSLP